MLGEAEHTFKDALEAVTTLRVRLPISSSSRIDRACLCACMHVVCW